MHVNIQKKKDIEIPKASTVITENELIKPEDPRWKGLNEDQRVAMMERIRQFTKKSNRAG